MKTAKNTYHHGDLKRVLLETAENLLEKGGIANLSLRKVASNAGVSHTAPYRHFSNKTALLAALANLGYMRLTQAMRAVLENYPDDPMAQLLNAGTAYVNLAVVHPEMTDLMFGRGLEDCSDVDYKSEVVNAYAVLEEIIDNGLKAGIYKNKEKSDLALTAWSLIHGLTSLIIGGRMVEITNVDKPDHVLAFMVGEILLSGMQK